jgi:hypothetical protein
MHDRYALMRRFWSERTPQDRATYLKWRNGVLLIYGSLFALALAAGTSSNALVTASSNSASRHVTAVPLAKASFRVAQPDRDTCGGAALFARSAFSGCVTAGDANGGDRAH